MFSGLSKLHAQVAVRYYWKLDDAMITTIYVIQFKTKKPKAKKKVIYIYI